MSKGSKTRPILNKDKFNYNWDKIFNETKKSQQKKSSSKKSTNLQQT